MRVLLAFKSGAVCVYDLNRRRIDFQTEQGHSETIFDAEFCKANGDYLASCSYDGTVRIWDTKTMKLNSINDTSRQGPQAKLSKRIIYSVSWHPTDTKIALGTFNGNLIIYDALKQKYLGAVTPVEGAATYKVQWNNKNPEKILMSSHSKNAFLIKTDDTCKNLNVELTYAHPDIVFGLCWSPDNERLFLTACMDGNVRMFDTTTAHPNSTRVFVGHKDKIYNVIFNAQIHNIFVSGSDDRTIRVWDIENKADNMPIQILGGPNIKGSHENNIRALQFLPEVPWCLLSGSWDSTIKLWDIRSGNCMFTITDHNADVYGITFHPQKPFLFASCSRDTTLRLFVVDRLISALKMQLLSTDKLDNSGNKLLDQPDAAYK